MNQYVTGAVIKELREKNKMTQLQLAEKLGVSDKTVSKWETAKGYPDITLLEPIAEAFSVSVTELISGNAVYNSNVSANVLKSKFYICPICGNVICSMGEAVIHCHGVLMTAAEPEEDDGNHKIYVERIEDEYYVRTCSGGKLNVYAVRRYRTPAVGYGAAAFAVEHCLGSIEAVVHSEETLPVRVKGLHRAVGGIESIVVAALAIFSLVVDNAAFHLHLAGREVALEILHIRGCVQQAPFSEREEFEPFGLSAKVAQAEFLYFSIASERNEEESAGPQAVLFAADAGVAHAVGAFVGIKLSLARLPARIPYASFVVDIEITSAIVGRNAVVAISGNPSELGVLIEGVSSGRRGNQGKEILRAKIVDPGPRELRVGYDEFPATVVEMSVLSRHIKVLNCKLFPECRSCRTCRGP